MIANRQRELGFMSVEGVTKTFPLPDGSSEYTVLKNVSFTVERDEVVALLGRSGCGKSTLLRILAGLIAPTEGRVLGDGKPLLGPNPDVAMVFQSFALLPWLTVGNNVELGLTARAVEKRICQERAREAIRMVGLSGFENAYPRELSGGMRQRVGFARAFVIRPKVLMMDEPFSALDVLTAENLRGEIEELWASERFPARSILLVTHNIEEAVTLADRVVILGANPGCIRGELLIDLEHPRDRKSPRFAQIVEYIYGVMTHPDALVNVLESKAPRFPRLPHARVGAIGGLVEILADYGGRVELPQLADQLRLEVDDLLPIVDAAVLLSFVEASQSHAALTLAGKKISGSDVQARKKVFREQLFAHVPLIGIISAGIRQTQTGSVPADFFLDLLQEHFSEKEARKQFNTVIEWARYAELFEFNADDERIRLHADSTE